MMTPHNDVISGSLSATAKTSKTWAARRRRWLAALVLGLAVSSPVTAGTRLKIKTSKIFAPLQTAAGEALDGVTAAADKTLAAARAEVERLGAHVGRYLKDPTTPLRDAAAAARSETARLQSEVKRLEGEVERVTRAQTPEFVADHVRQMRQSFVSSIQVPDLDQVGGVLVLPEFPAHLTTDMRRVLTEGTLAKKALDFDTLGKAAAAAARHTEKALIQNPANEFDRQFNRALETAGELRQEALATARREMEAAKNVAEAIARDPARIADEAKKALRTMYTAGNRQELRGYYDKAGDWVKAAEGELTEQTRAGVRTFVTLGNQQILTGYYDKSGRWVKQNEKMLITIAVVAALSATPGGQTLAGQMLIAGMQAYYTSNGDLKATAIAMATAGAFFGVGSLGLDTTTVAGAAGKVVLHGAVGGASSAANGGRFQDGFVAAAISQTASVSGLYGAVGDNTFAQTATAAAVGGTAAEATGGKFEDGATMAVMSHLANSAATSVQESDSGIEQAIKASLNEVSSVLLENGAVSAANAALLDTAMAGVAAARALSALVPILPVSPPAESYGDDHFYNAVQDYHRREERQGRGNEPDEPNGPKPHKAPPYTPGENGSGKEREGFRPDEVPGKPPMSSEPRPDVPPYLARNNTPAGKNPTEPELPWWYKPAGREHEPVLPPAIEIPDESHGSDQSRRNPETLASSDSQGPTSLSPASEPKASSPSDPGPGDAPAKAPARKADPEDIHRGGQNKHISGTNENKTAPDAKTLWANPFDADRLTIEAFENGKVARRNPDGSYMLKYDTGRRIGNDGETWITVHVKPTGKFHGHPSGKKGDN